MDTYDLISELSAALLDCLCTAVSGMPAADRPSNCCYRVGTEPVHGISLDQLDPQDLCCQGLAYVMVGDVFPSTASFPDADIVRQTQGACDPPAWAVAYRVGIVGCIPSSDECAPNNAAFLTNLRRIQALNQFFCCARAYIRNSDTFLGMNLVAERQVQGSTSGGCTERYVNITAQIPNLDCSCG